MTPRDSRPPTTIVAGAGLYVLLSAFDLIGTLLFPPPPDVPPIVVNSISIGLGLLTLAPLALWWTRGPRWALVLATVVRVLSALVGMLAFTDGEAAGTALLATSAGFAVLTVVAIVLLAPAFARSRPPVPAG